MAVVGIDHLAIIVNDLEASERNWCDTFGATVARRSEAEGFGMRQLYLAFPEGPQLELVTPIDDSSPIASLLAEHGEGFRGMTLMVDNVDETLAELEAQGVRTFTQGGTVFVHPGDANGMVVSFMNRDD